MDRVDVDRWLGHLPRDPRGRPVPWVNRWGPEDPALISVRTDPLVGQLAVFLDDDRAAGPDFLHMNMGRQRQAMVEGLCQVCARPVPWSRRNLVVSTVSTETVWIPQWRRSAVVVVEAWLDDRCVQVATRLCPALIRRRRADDLTVVPVRSPREVRLVLSYGLVDGFEEYGTGVGMWVKAALRP